MNKKNVDQKKRLLRIRGSKSATPRRKTSKEKLSASKRKTSAEQYACATVDALEAHICVLNRSGVILSVNRAWEDFARANFGEMAKVSRDANYLAVCDAAKGDDAEIASSVARVIRSIIDGKSISFTVEYPCHSPGEKRWFIARITNYPGDGEARVVIAHENITARKLAEENLETSEKSFRDLYENISDMIVAVNPDGIIKFANPATKNILGYEPSDVIGTTVLDYAHPDDQTTAVQTFDNRIQHPEDPPGIMEIRARHQDGSWRTLEVIGNNMFEHPTIRGIVITARDITERKRAEDELRFAKAQMQTAINNIPFDFWMCDARGRYLMQNPTAIRHWGNTIGKHPAELKLDSKILAIWQQNNLRALAGEPVRNEITYTSGGESRIVENILAPVREGEQILGFVGLNIDITERKRAEEERAELLAQMQTSREQLRALSNRLVQVQEQERRDLARELHDEIGQWLTGLKLILHMTADMSQDKILANIDQAQTLLAELVARVRDLALDLRPALLDDLGIVPTLAWYLKRYTKQTRVKTIFEHTNMEGKRFDSQMETTAFRIVQEGLTNIALHAQVEQATVRVWTIADTLQIQIEDSGTGFDPGSIFATGEASGLTGMRERAKLLGGNLIIDSAPNQGTRLTAELPLAGHLKESA